MAIYDWATIPIEFEFAATDKNMSIWAYRNKPTLINSGSDWMNQSEFGAEKMNPNVLLIRKIKYYDSLEMRPCSEPETEYENFFWLENTKETKWGNSTKTLIETGNYTNI